MHIVLNIGLRRAARRGLAKAEATLLRHLPARRNTAMVVPPGAVTLVYRSRNTGFAEVLVRQARAAGLRVYLWGLDGVAAPLAADTIGHGPGLRSVLHTRLVEAAGLADSDYLVVCDDDVEFAVGGFKELLQIAAEGGFMVCQPAHVRDSHYSFAFTRGRFSLTARRTHFVEIGPMVVIHPAFRGRVFPMRAALGMGWGAEVEWHSALRPGEYLGIVDAVQVRHRGEIGVEYDTAAEQARLDMILREAGFERSLDMCAVIEPWYRWRRGSADRSSFLKKRSKRLLSV